MAKAQVNTQNITRPISGEERAEPAEEREWSTKSIQRRRISAASLYCAGRAHTHKNEPLTRAAAPRPIVLSFRASLSPAFVSLRRLRD